MAARSDRYPALAASAVLHAVVLVAALAAWPWSRAITAGDVVPVTLISSSDLQTPAPAVRASTPAPPATPAPVTQTTPEAVAPEEHQTPAPAKTPPAPVAHVSPTPAKAKPQPEPKENWSALEASLSAQDRPSGARQSSAARGPARPNQALQARATQGVAATLASGAASPQANAALGALQGELAHLWNPNCGVPVGDLMIKVTFRIGSNGALVGDPTASGAGGDLASRVASERAMRAVRLADPFADPSYAALYGQNVTVSFAQNHHCSS